MVEAYVLIQTAIGKLAQVAGEATLMQQVATQAAGVEGVKAVAVVAGPYDLIARVAA